MAKVILIVEDEPKSIKWIRDILQVSGYSTIEATNGKQGVEFAKANKPDLILMDVQMPVMDGLEATRILKADTTTRNIPVIALTSYAMIGDKEKFLRVGCDGYLAKPVDIDLLLDAISKFLPNTRV